MEGILKWNPQTNQFVINFTDLFGNNENYQLSKRTNSFPPGYENQLDGEFVEFTFITDESGIRVAELISPIIDIYSNEISEDKILEEELRDQIINQIKAFANPSDSANRILELVRDSKYKILFRPIIE